MDLGTINFILIAGLTVYFNVKIYKWAHTLNPYDFSNRR